MRVGTDTTFLEHTVFYAAVSNRGVFIRQASIIGVFTLGKGILTARAPCVAGRLLCA